MTAASCSSAITPRCPAGDAAGFRDAFVTPVQPQTVNVRLRERPR